MRFTIAFFLFVLASCKQSKEYRGWPLYGGTDNMHYSTLTEIDTTNVQQLQVAWTYRTGDADSVHKSQIQCNPVMINGALYGTTAQMKLFAVDAATGKEKWVFNPFDSLSGDKRTFFILNNSRGVSYWSDGKEDHRVFYTAGSYLYCVNAATGRTVPTFGDSGKIDLHEGLGRDVSDLFITATSPGAIYRDLIIMGSRVDEGAAAAPGHIRAYNVRTGKQEWIFHTIPYPGEEGYDTWEDTAAYKNIGGANAWSGFTVDEKNGIVFAGTGSASYDFYGGRRKGANLFANCILALDAATGKKKWHFQTIHHDLWDHDLPAPPVLVTLKKDGKNIEAVAQTTKTGFVFVMERSTGKPVYPVDEVAVPTQSELQDEWVSPTQPVPRLPEPFVRQVFGEKDINHLLPEAAQQEIRSRLAGYKTGNMFHPPSKGGTVIFPGFDGGAEWGGPAFDPQSGWLFVNANEMPWVLTIVDVKKVVPKDETYGAAGKRLYQAHCMACHGKELQGSGNFPSLQKVHQSYRQEQILDLLVSGRRMMPAFKQLNNEEREAIAGFLLNKEASGKFIPASKPENRYRQLPYTITGYNKFLTKEGAPAISPPWGTLNAIDLNTGKIIWKTTLGNDTAYAKGGSPTGTENYGGPVVTKGGVLFIAATKDNKFRAFHKRTGQLLWETDLPASGFATPTTYEWNGRQYIVIACGGGKLGTPSGDSYVAFALPQKK